MPRCCQDGKNRLAAKLKLSSNPSFRHPSPNITFPCQTKMADFKSFALAVVLFTFLTVSSAQLPQINSLSDVETQVTKEPLCIQSCALKAVIAAGCSSLSDLACDCTHKEISISVLECISSSKDDDCPAVSKNSSIVQSAEELVIASCQYYANSLANLTRTTNASFSGNTTSTSNNQTLISSAFTAAIPNGVSQSCSSDIFAVLSATTLSTFVASLFLVA